MRALLSSISSVAVALTATAALAQNPFVGFWKIKTAPGQVVGEVVTFEPTANGAIREISPGLPLITFTLDGKGIQDAHHVTVTWRKINDHVFQRATTASFMPPIIETRTLSDNDNTLLYEYDTHRLVSNRAVHRESHYVRVAGHKGLLGSWKNTDIVSKEEAIMRWTPSGPNAIHMEMPDMHASVDLSLDGRECRLTGPMVPPGVTVTATRTGTRSFDLRNKINGRVLGHTSYQLSEDGQTLTAVGTHPNGAPIGTEVYGRVL